MTYDLVIEGKIITEVGIVQSYLCIEAGRISKVSRTTPGHGAVQKRYHGCLLLPGCIDTHVHFRDPGMTHKEDFASGSISAAFGGVTTVMDMPNTRPPTLDQKSFLEKNAIAKERSYIDFGLHLGVTPASDPETTLDRLRSGRGTPFPVGLKVFLGESTGSLVFRPIESLSTVIRTADRYGLPLAIHAEDGDLLHPEPGEGGRMDRGALTRHLRDRPAEAEVSAMDRALTAAGERAGAVHFLHVSSKEGIERAKRSNASVEVTPHHLLLDLKWCEENLEMETLAKVNPPIRTTDDRAALWDALLSGSVTTIGSDHAPHLLKEKENLDQAPSGMPGTETMLPLLLHEFIVRKLDIMILQRALSERPAMRFNMGNRGSFEPGHYADIAVMDLKGVRKVRAEDLHSRCGWTPYEGLKAIFPKAVYSRGELTVEDDNICCRPGRGSDLSMA